MPRLPVRTISVEVLDGPGQGLSASASDSLTVGTAEQNDLVLSDDTVSRFHLELTRRPDRILARDCGSTNGTAVGDVLIKEALISPGTELQLGKTRVRVADGQIVDVEILAEGRFGQVVGDSPTMRKLMAQLSKVAQTETSVLLLGETGCGKEVMAHAVHDASKRADARFETVDCGALHPTLIASELFGHERGAFTGADRRYVGAFERAHGGTLFLDEVGELPPQVQATLLGALERRRFRRVGGAEEIEVDVRVISATHRDLLSDINTSAFRQDLFYRLGVVTLRIPALRDRVEDLPSLTEHFLREAGFTGRVDEVIDQEVLRQWERHPWPGNVRELRNLVEATLALGEAPELMTSAAPEVDAWDLSFPRTLIERPYREARNTLLDQFELEYVRDLLQRNQGNAAASAREAKMNRSYLFELIKKHRLR